MKKWMIPLTSVLLIASLSGCGMSRGTSPHAGPTTQGTVNQAAHTRTAPGTQTGMGTNSIYSTPMNQDGWNRYPAATTDGRNPAATTYPGSTTDGRSAYETNRLLSDRIVKAADSVPGVSNAVAVVHRNDAVVGINTRTTAADARQRKVIEQRVYSAVRAVAPHHTIHVTSDPKLISRIHAMDQTVRAHYYAHPTTHPFRTGPTSVTQNAANVGTDFATLIRDMGRTVTAPFR